MKKYFTEGRIKNVLLGTADQGIVYDQNVIFELENGMNLELFDYKLLISANMVSNRKKILIKILDSEFPVQYRRKKIYMQEKKISYDKGYDIYGEIVDKILIRSDEFTPYEDCIFDFGMGYMLLSTKVREFNIRDFVYAHAARLDIFDVFDTD
ncbi:MAG: hypothetical protein FIB08_03465 [Candidatus Methanoperedens sp.]|nr:hypothetical protein [Candidatus Methanoperedens sp.]